MEAVEQPEKIVCKHCGRHTCFKENTITDAGTEATSYMCVGCGYTTTSLNKLNSPTVTLYEESTAELIKSLRYVDDEELVWYPIVLNFPTVGIIFPEGASNLDWWWTIAPAVDIPEEERSKYPIPGADGEYYTKRVDMEQKQQFAPDQFYDACKAVGFIINEELV